MADNIPVGAVVAASALELAQRLYALDPPTSAVMSDWNKRQRERRNLSRALAVVSGCGFWPIKCAETESPDFRLTLADGRTVGVEITEQVSENLMWLLAGGQNSVVEREAARRVSDAACGQPTRPIKTSVFADDPSLRADAPRLKDNKAEQATLWKRLDRAEPWEGEGCGENKAADWFVEMFERCLCDKRQKAASKHWTRSGEDWLVVRDTVGPLVSIDRPGNEWTHLKNGVQQACSNQGTFNRIVLVSAEWLLDWDGRELTEHPRIEYWPSQTFFSPNEDYVIDEAQLREWLERAFADLAPVERQTAIEQCMQEWRNNKAR